MPASPEDLLAYLATLGVETETVDHPPLFTVEDSQALRGEILGGHTKNLFVKDKKGRLFLLVLGEESLVDLKKGTRKDWRAGSCFLRFRRFTGRGLGRSARRRDAVWRDQRQGGQGFRRAG
jgi:hypothetical protein